MANLTVEPGAEGLAEERLPAGFSAGGEEFLAEKLAVGEV